MAALLVPEIVIEQPGASGRGREGMAEDDEGHESASDPHLLLTKTSMRRVMLQKRHDKVSKAVMSGSDANGAAYYTGTFKSIAFKMQI